MVGLSVTHPALDWLSQKVAYFGSSNRLALFVWGVVVVLNMWLAHKFNFWRLSFKQKLAVITRNVLVEDESGDVDGEEEGGEAKSQPPPTNGSGDGKNDASRRSRSRRDPAKRRSAAARESLSDSEVSAEMGSPCTRRKKMIIVGGGDGGSRKRALSSS